jgi:NAD(P)-dependent dehydrogenase (short-subunit alcohol dehydrogenase family)
MGCGKIVVVTGGTRGIGAAISVELSRNDYKVVALYGSDDGRAASFAEQHEGIDVIRCDVTDADMVNRTIKKISKEYEGINALVNNAGIIADGYFLLMSEKNFDRVLDTNLKGNFHVTKAVLMTMKAAKKGGSVVNISSISGIAGQVAQANYSASKGAIISLTKTLAKEFAPDGIRVNAVSPGFIETEMTAKFSRKDEILNLIPLKRFGKPEEVAYLTAFLLSDKAAYITGKNFTIDGGMIND